MRKPLVKSAEHPFVFSALVNAPIIIMAGILLALMPSRALWAKVALFAVLTIGSIIAGGLIVRRMPR